MVRLRRNIYNIWDILEHTGPSVSLISSGSAVEGLDMKGSDVDIMLLCRDIVVCTSESDAVNIAEKQHIIALIMDTDHTNPCFALLRVPKSVPFPENTQCFLIHKRRKNPDDRTSSRNLSTRLAMLPRFCFFSGAFHTLYNPNHDSDRIHTMLRTQIQHMTEYFEREENLLVILKKILHFSGIQLEADLIVFCFAKLNNLQQNTTPHYNNNKPQYHQFKQQQSRLLISSHAEISEVGWLFLASFFYRHKRYHIV
ncbi:unnamed protein product [Mytilus coruscus]|uniref:Uncharacterized protein n=1 Tax=Mytilus coruscus TaxID=42192 RepID=A0A6J8CE47_MYTCO|nr:unnamed protein product [Mytilus coruscus]